MINQHAIIDPAAKLGANVKVGSFTTIGANVEIGDNTEIGPNVVISGRTKIGSNNKIFQFASIGADPQDLKYKGEDTLLEVGDNNIIREYCSLNRGTVQGGGKTVIGNNNLFMAYVHIAHDCIVGNDVVFANNTTLGGHVVVEDCVLFGGFAVVAQFCLIGAYCFIAGTTGVMKDILPYTLVSNYHSREAKTYGLNIIGLHRRGFSEETIKQLKKAYHVICREGLTVQQAVEKLTLAKEECPEIQRMIDMLEKSKHGIVK